MNEQMKKISWIIAAVGGVLVLVMLGSILSNISSIETELERNGKDLDAVLEVLEDQEQTEEQTEPVESEAETKSAEIQEEAESTQPQEGTIPPAQ